MISFSYRIFHKVIITLSLFSVVTISINSSAQDLGVLMKKEAAGDKGSSSVAVLDSNFKDYKYSKSMNESAKREIITTLGIDQLSALFEKLEDSDKQDLFSLLSNTQKRNLISRLSDQDKQKAFQTLGDEEKIDLFNIMDDADRMVILSNIGHIEKSRLIDSLPQADKSAWLAKYPELGSEIDLMDEETGEDVTGESRLEKIFSGQFPTDVNKNLHQFGYDFFGQNAPFTPETNVPVGPDYIMGTDDSFTIHLWGKVEETHHATVSRDGTITLPRLGTLNIDGLTFSELKKFLNNKYKEYYPDFTMSITMGNLKVINIFMVGELNRPGTYNLSSLSTVVSALFASGGPSKNGSLRNINVLKNGELLKTIDLYEFFINGSKGDDISLKQGYTVHVPVIGPTAAISGLVKRPAIYELKGNQTLEELIEMAGGVMPTGRLQNVIVERITEHQRRVVISFDLDQSKNETSQNLKTVIEDGDLIKISPIHKKIEKIVYLEGNVKYPSEYELKEGMKIKDIIPSYDYLLPEPYLPQAEIIRLIPPDLHPEIKTFDLET